LLIEQVLWEYFLEVDPPVKVLRQEDPLLLGFFVYGSAIIITARQEDKLMLEEFILLQEEMHLVESLL
jgi:hypothetical protein